jgi:radical SAM protein with 4Fe4S-binding SPASM domain
LHGAKPKTHDKLVGRKGSFEKVIKNLKLFTKWKQKLKTKRPYLEIGVVLVNKNYKEIVEIVEIANSLDAQAVFIEPLTIYTPTGKKLKMEEKDYKIFKSKITKAKYLAESWRIESNFSDFLTPTLIEKAGNMIEVIKSKTKGKDFFSTPCYEPWYRMGVRVDGTACPCGFFDEESWENVREKSLRKIWFGEYFNLRRRQMLTGDLPKHCRKCCTTLVANNRNIRNELEKFRFLKWKK